MTTNPNNQQCPGCGYETRNPGDLCDSCETFRQVKEFEKLIKKALSAQFCMSFVESLAKQNKIPQDQYETFLTKLAILKQIEIYMKR